MGMQSQRSWDQIRSGLRQGLASTNGIYSSWNWNKGLYDYFESPEAKRPSYGDEVPPPPTQNALGSSALGEDPDRSSHRRPLKAKYVGSGPVALGEIVSVVDGASPVSPWVGVVLALAIPTAILWATVKLGDLIGEHPDDEEVGS